MSCAIRPASCAPTWKTPCVPPFPALSLDDAFARKDDVAFDVQKTVGNEMSRFGFTVVKTLITAIDPSPAGQERHGLHQRSPA